MIFNTIRENLKWARIELRTHNIPNPTREAGLILNLCLNNSNHLLISQEANLTQNQLNKYNRLISQRCDHKPFAYLSQTVNFCSLDFFVNQNVLIPRPETEELVEIIIDYLKNLPQSNSVIASDLSRVKSKEAWQSSLKITEIGTGSGAISIALAKSLHDFPSQRDPAQPAVACFILHDSCITLHASISFTATDISSDALKVASRNIAHYHLIDQINLKKSDLLTDIPGSIDILIANLPYISTHELKNLTEDIIAYEPKIALDGGPDGLELITKLLHQAQPKLSKNGVIFLEIWHTHGPQIKKIAKALFPNSHTKIITDLAGLPRFAVITI